MTRQRAELGDVALVDGRIAQVRSINEGNRAITFEIVGQERCPHCGHDGSVTINEGVPLWEQRVKPVTTCG